MNVRNRFVLESLSLPPSLTTQQMLLITWYFFIDGLRGYKKYEEFWKKVIFCLNSLRFLNLSLYFLKYPSYPMWALQYRHTDLSNKAFPKLCSAKPYFVSFSPQKKSLTASLFIKESVAKKSGERNMVCPQLF